MARKGDYLPVDSVRRGDCNQFMRKIEAHCHGVRAWLPTEVQWEYACRAGTTDEYAGVIDLVVGGLLIRRRELSRFWTMPSEFRVKNVHVAVDFASKMCYTMW